MSPVNINHTYVTLICSESLGYQAGIVCSLWKENKVWKNISEVQKLPCGRSSRVSGPLSPSLYPHLDWHSCPNWGSKNVWGAWGTIAADTNNPRLEVERA